MAYDTERLGYDTTKGQEVDKSAAAAPSLPGHATAPTKNIEELRAKARNALLAQSLPSAAGPTYCRRRRSDTQVHNAATLPRASRPYQRLGSNRSQRCNSAEANVCERLANHTRTWGESDGGGVRMSLEGLIFIPFDRYQRLER